MINKLDIMCFFGHLNLYKNKNRVEKKGEEICSVMIILIVQVTSPGWRSGSLVCGPRLKVCRQQLVDWS